MTWALAPEVRLFLNQHWLFGTTASPQRALVVPKSRKGRGLQPLRVFLARQRSAHPQSALAITGLAPLRPIKSILQTLKLCSFGQLWLKIAQDDSPGHTRIPERSPEGTAEEMSHRHVGCLVHVVFATPPLCGILRGSTPPPSAHEGGTGPRPGEQDGKPQNRQKRSNFIELYQKPPPIQSRRDG